MNAETIKKIEEYKTQLTTKLKEAQDERKALVDKVSKGESLSRKENKRNQQLAEIIAELQKKLDLFREVDLYNGILKGFEDLANSKLSADAKNKIIASLLKTFKSLNKEADKELADLTGLSAKELKDLSSTKTKLETELKELEKELEAAKKRGFDTKAIQEEIDEKKAILEHIENYLKGQVDLLQLEADLKTIANSKTKKADKDAIIEKYKKDIELSRNSALEDIVIEMENDKKAEEEKKEKRKFLKARTKKEKEEKDNILKKHWKKIVGVISAIILIIVIMLLAKSCNKQINNTSTENTKDPYSIETMYENVDKAKLKKLVDKGYDEYLAVIMLNNLPSDVIDTLLQVPYIAAIEEYAQAKDLNLNYIEDYEDARIKYEITADKAVDYVNRAYQIQATGFYQDATINEIVEVVMALDNKTLFTTNNANLAQSFNTSFNGVVEHALFGNTTADDVKKLDALQYFAAEGSDMDLFLTEFATITKKVLANPTDEAAKKEAYNYIATFALTLNGFKNTDEDIKIEQPYSTNAQVKDYYDWYMAYNSFIAPLYPLYINDTNYPEFEYLQYVMITALQGPEFEMICGESLGLGGN
ncbi:MAG: hypothetical protein IJN13_00650 [Bacilli bacterium]|nr:hypothetical protein [Bacilli bacterium]